MFSSLQNLSKNKRDKHVFDEKMKIAEKHMEFCLELYAIQVRGGRYFLHEHPNGASSWRMKSMVKIMAKDNVHTTACDMCAYGLTTKDGEGEALVEKRTRLMSNSPEIIKRVSNQCTNRGGKDASKHHRYGDVTCGRARQCQVYPKAFCRAVCSGIAAQKRLDELGLKAMPIMSTEEMLNTVPEDLKAGDPAADLHEDDPFDDPRYKMEAFDDVSGAELDPILVRLARQEEMEYF